MDPSIAVAVTLVIAAMLAFELNISSAIIEILAGVLLAAWLGDLADLGWLHFLANLGMLGLMFMAGFEVDVNRLRDTWKASVLIGVCSLAAPLAGVFLVSYYVIGVSLLAAGLISVALSTTSLALVFQGLKERGLLQRDLGQTVLAAATVVDVLSMVVLAIILGEVGWGTAIFLLVVIPSFVGLPQLGRWIFRRYRYSLVELELRFVLVLLVSIGFMAEQVGGIHPAVVAFALGLVLSEVVDSHDEVEEKLKGIVFSFFAPIFFLHAGTKFDLSVISLDSLWVALLLFIVACGLKFVGTAVPAQRLLALPGRFVGLLFNYRLSFGIISATVGLNMGVLSEQLYGIVLLVVVTSAALPVIFLRDRPTEVGLKREAGPGETGP